MTDIAVYKDMLTRAGEPFEEKAGNVGTTQIISSLSPNKEWGSYFAVIAVFNPDGSMKGISPDGCTWDCGHCRS